MQTIDLRGNEWRVVEGAHIICKKVEEPASYFHLLALRRRKDLKQGALCWRPEVTAGEAWAVMAGDPVERQKHEARPINTLGSGGWETVRDVYESLLNLHNDAPEPYAVGNLLLRAIEANPQPLDDLGLRQFFASLRNAEITLQAALQKGGRGDG